MDPITPIIVALIGAAGVVAAAWLQSRVMQLREIVKQIAEIVKQLEDAQADTQELITTVGLLNQDVGRLQKTVPALERQNEVISQRLERLEKECRPEPPDQPDERPAAPTMLVATPGHRQVRLTWVAPRAAASYNVYRMAGSGGGEPVLLQEGLAATSFIDPGLSNGVPYSYQVTAVNAAGESARSGVVRATPVHPILTWTWEQYVRELHQLDRDSQRFGPFGLNGVHPSCLQSRLIMLRQVVPLAQQRIETLGVPELKALFGMETPEYPSAGWLGCLKVAQARRLLTKIDRPQGKFRPNLPQSCKASRAA